MSAIAITLLQRFLNRTARSLACYSVHVRPWVSYRREGLWQVIEEIASRHRELSIRLSEEIVRRGGIPNPGGFPPANAGYHDLAIEYIAPKIISELEKTLNAVKQALCNYHDDSKLRELLQQIADEFTAELESLQESLYGTESDNHSNHSAAA
jgi:hypothetical protein